MPHRSSFRVQKPAPIVLVLSWFEPSPAAQMPKSCVEHSSFCAVTVVLLGACQVEDAFVLVVAVAWDLQGFPEVFEPFGLL